MSAKARIRRILIQIHLWAGLTIGALWALQGLTGALLVFHRDVDAAVLPGTAGPMASLDRVAAAVRDAGAAEIARISIRDGARRVLTVDFTDGTGKERTLLVDAATATPLLARDYEPAAPGGGGTSRWLYHLHESLLLGHKGEILIGISGLLLLGAALMGVWIGWPHGGRGWRIALSPSKWRSPVQRVYGWHRGAGLFVGFALCLMVPAGAWMIFASDLRPALARVVPFARSAPIAPAPAGFTPAIGPEAALRNASARFPNASFVRATMPDAARPAYVVRVLQPGEARGWSGTTSVTVSAVDGRVLDTYDALAAPAGSRLADAAFAVHSGEIAGLPGRILVMLAGLSLPMLYITGLVAWLRKRRRRSG